MKISIIIPVLNESEHLEEMLKRIQKFSEHGHETIIVDGGSTDNTVDIAKKYTECVVASKKGRALQMNSGADIATGEALLFLHADTILPTDACELINANLGAETQWGRFDVRLSGSWIIFRVIEYFINWRSRMTSIATGDQAIFLTRDLFDKVGGFPEIPLMEDVALSRLLKRESKPACLKSTVVTSSRRWEKHGVIKTVFLMWRLRFLYFIGVSPTRLSKRYT